MPQMTDLQRAFDALDGKARPYSRFWDYYDGDQPLKYSTERLREIFSGIDATFRQNWCAVVVDACLDRIELREWTVSDDDEATDALNELYDQTELNLDDESIHTAALVCGESYVIAWKDPETEEVEAYYNDPRLVHVFYDPEHPRQKAYAAKWWVDGEDHRRMTLYYPDRLEYYVSTQKSSDVTNADGFVPADPPTAANPYGVVPVFHFLKERRSIVSELKNVLDLQDAVNKLFSDMMVAAEFGAFRQRYVISSAESIGALRNAPNEIWDIPAAAVGEGIQPTTVGEFQETSLNGYLEAIGRLAATAAIVTRTPKHYLFEQGGDPSGEALIAMESPLTSKATRYIERFTPRWRELAAFLLLLKGITVEDPRQIEPVFASPHTVQPKTSAEIAESRVRAGMPLRTVLRHYEAWSDADLELLDVDLEDDAAQKQQGMAAALFEAQRRFDAGNQEPQPQMAGGNGGPPPDETE